MKTPNRKQAILENTVRHLRVETRLLKSQVANLEKRLRLKSAQLELEVWGRLKMNTVLLCVPFEQIDEVTRRLKREGKLNQFDVQLRRINRELRKLHRCS